MELNQSQWRLLTLRISVFRTQLGRVEISRLWGRWEEEPNHVTLTSPPAVAFSMDAVDYAQCIASVPDAIQITVCTQL